MKINKITAFFVLIFLFIPNINISNAAINLTVSPIKEEITINPGETISRVAKLTNNTANSLHIITGKSDFEPSGDNGKPNFIRKSELVFPDQQLSEWITIDVPSFDIAAKQTKTINYTLTVPANATPGGHYGAVFFKNNNSEVSNGTAVGINVDYGIIILVNVTGEQRTNIQIQDPIIKKTDGGRSRLKKDNCPFGDLTSSYFDGKCIDDIAGIISDITGKEDLTEDINNENISNLGDNNSNSGNTSSGNIDTKDKINKEKKDDFGITFEIPIKNKGNTHIKPTGGITLIDENGNKIKQTGKEFIVNDAGVIVGEKIVDYIPINDFGGSVIPGFDRKYICDWKGFAYKKYDPNEQKDIVSYWSPSEYYTKQNEKDAGFIMFWERINEKLSHKKITAIFDISYKDEKGKDIEFNSAQDFYVDYKEKYVGLNPYIIIPLVFLGFLFFLFWIIAFKRKRKCPNCGKKVDKDMKICPYCGEKLHKSNRGRKKIKDIVSTIIPEKNNVDTIIKKKNKKELEKEVKTRKKLSIKELKEKRNKDTK